jgi:hypothetical protein
MYVKFEVPLLTWNLFFCKKFMVMFKCRLEGERYIHHVGCEIGEFFYPKIFAFSLFMYVASAACCDMVWYLGYHVSFRF